MTVQNDHVHHSSGQLPHFFRGGICAFGLHAELPALACRAEPVLFVHRVDALIAMRRCACAMMRSQRNGNRCVCGNAPSLELASYVRSRTDAAPRKDLFFCLAG